MLQRPTVPESATPPACSKCQSRMWPAKVIPGLSELAQRIFECSKCGHLQIRQDAD
jgi:transposase